MEFRTYKNYFEQHLLIHLHEFLIPLVDISSPSARVIVISRARRIVLVMSAPLDHLFENRFVDLYGTPSQTVEQDGNAEWWGSYEHLG